MRVSKHGSFRTRKRGGIPKRTVRKMVAVALERGLTYDQTTGSLRRYIDAIRLRDGTYETVVKVYGTMTFIFKENTLVTAFQTPSKYHKLVAKLIRERERRNER